MASGNVFIILGIILLAISLVTRYEYNKKAKMACPHEVHDLKEPVILGLSYYDLVMFTSGILSIISFIIGFIKLK